MHLYFYILILKGHFFLYYLIILKIQMEQKNMFLFYLPQQ